MIKKKDVKKLAQLYKKNANNRREIKYALIRTAIRVPLSRDFIVSCLQEIIKIRSPDSVPLLSDILLKNYQCRLGVDVAKMLVEIADEQAIDTFCEIINLKPERWAEEMYSEVHEHVLDALEKLKNPKSINCIISSLKLPNGQRRKTEILIKFKDLALRPLLKALTNEDDSIRRQAAFILGELKNNLAVDSLLGALNDKYSMVRIEIVKALGKIGDIRAVEPITKLVENPKNVDSYLKLAIMNALNKLGYKIAINSIFFILLDDGSENVRKEAAMSLDNVGWHPKNAIERAKYFIAKREWEKLSDFDSQTIEYICQFLETNIKSHLSSKNSKEIVQELMLKLLESNDKRVIELLFNFYNEVKWRTNEDKFRTFIINKLENAGTLAIEALKKVIQNDPREEDKKRAMIALVRLGDLRAAELLINWLFSHDPLSNQSLTKFRDKKGEIVNYFFINSIESEIMERNFFGNYTDIILRARNLEAFKKLCNIFTLISTNLLHMLVQYSIVKLEVYYPPSLNIDDDRGFSQIETLDFSYLTERSKKELLRRGNPPHDPIAYLDENAWKEVF